MPYLQNRLGLWPITLLLARPWRLMPDSGRPDRGASGRLRDGSTPNPDRMPFRPLPAAGLGLLVVASQAERRAALLQCCGNELPHARLVTAAALSDAVLSLARGGLHLVVLDLAQLPPLSPAAILVMRGMAPGVRVLAVGGERDPGTPGMEWVADQQALLDWLRRAIGSD